MSQVKSPVKIASWNINSVRLRAGLVQKFAADHGPDILCLQEIKCRDEEFPEKALRDAGFSHFYIRGQKAYHGVAIASKIPLFEAPLPDFCLQGDSRVAAVKIGSEKGPILHNLYVPAGGDEADPDINPKFAHKLDFLAKMKAHYAAMVGQDLIVVGDINIAPHENDVWSHKALLDVVSHTPIETNLLAEILAVGQLVDLARHFHDADQKLYSWWSYRSADWTANDRGRRLDHIWTGGAMTAAAQKDSFAILRDARSWEKPSDHVPMMVDFLL